ncbi:MAG: N5-glutamine methyltransferase family protein, partial [Steroidobacteraceae bacterium]
MTTPEPAALLRDTLGWAVRRLETVDVASPRIDAELLLAHVLRISRRELARELLFGDRSLDSEEHVDFRRCVEQRADRVPLQHLTGVAPFRHIELAVGPGVFVPRPETELLAGWGIERLGSLREHGRQSERLCAVDLCAGSGAIALSLAHELPDVRAIAVEREGSALGWLARNVEALEPSRSSAVEIVDGDATSTRILSK